MSEQEIQQRNRQRTPDNRTTTGYRISDELWVVLQPLLPVHVNTHRLNGGRPRVLDLWAWSADWSEDRGSPLATI